MKVPPPRSATLDVLAAVGLVAAVLTIVVGWELVSQDQQGAG
jgi:hypothetical protein